MLDENDVVAAVCSHLEHEGYTIVQRLRTTQRGVDIIAEHPSRAGKLHIEAKGGTSARQGRPRYEPRTINRRCSTGLRRASTLPSPYTATIARTVAVPALHSRALNASEGTSRQ